MTFAMDGMVYFLKPVREIECSVGAYLLPGSRVIDLHDWELPDDAVVFEILQIVNGPAVWRVVEAPQGINGRQKWLLELFIKRGCFYIRKGKISKFGLSHVAVNK